MIRKNSQQVHTLSCLFTRLFTCLFNRLLNRQVNSRFRLQTLQRLCWSVVVASLLASCNPLETTPDCGDYFSENPAVTSRYSDLGRGLVLHNPTKTTWLKCPAGMSLSSADDCRGEPLYLSFDEAAAYAAEASEKSGQEIRLPNVGEMRALNEDACINPALDVRTFSSTVVENHWTSEASRTSGLLAGAVYTFQCNSSCRESKSTPYPFMLIIERD